MKSEVFVVGRDWREWERMDVDEVVVVKVLWRISSTHSGADGWIEWVALTRLLGDGRTDVTWWTPHLLRCSERVVSRLLTELVMAAFV